VKLPRAFPSAITSGADERFECRASNFLFVVKQANDLIEFARKYRFGEIGHTPGRSTLRTSSSARSSCALGTW
jgi:hypothetical protein